MGFYDRYLTLCKERGIAPTGKEISAVVKVSPTGINKWRNVQYPSVESVIKLAEYFNVSLEYMLGLTDIRGLDDYEKQLIKDFRSVDMEGRHRIIAACDRIREESEARAVMQDAQ